MRYMGSSSSDGLCYSDHVQQGAGYVSEAEQMFNLTTTADMIGFSKTHQYNNNNNSLIWKNFFAKHHAPPPPPASSSSNFYPPHHHNLTSTCDQTTISSTTDNHLQIQHDSSSSSATWQGHNNNNRAVLLDDDSCLQQLVFPRQLSLSLSSLQQDHHHHHHHALPFLHNSKFLLPAHQLLNEFCSLATTKNMPHNNNKQCKSPEDNNKNPPPPPPPPLTSSEFLELQKKKTKLLAMLQQVDTRYKHYCNQMKAVVSSFEAVAGNGAARVYSALALEAMSKHFRCLKDGILEQIQVTRKSMGEKDPATTRGETPRLKVIDQALRQQRAFQQMSIMEPHPWSTRPQRGLPQPSVSLLRAWLFDHFLNPYPSDVDKHILARQTGLSRSQVSNWFINARVRLWKPMVEEMYIEEANERDDSNNNTAAASSEDNNNIMDDNNVQNPISSPNEEDNDDDQKPTRARLLRIDSECVSSIINNNEVDPKNQLGRVTDAFGSVEIDFSSYSHHHAPAMVSYCNDANNRQSFNGGGAVSLTLGLQQHGVSLAGFPPGTQEGSMFYSRDQIEECQRVQYSLFDGEGQSMPYRNLMLHDHTG